MGAFKIDTDQLGYSLIQRVYPSIIEQLELALVLTGGNVKQVEALVIISSTHSETVRIAATGALNYIAEQKGLTA